MNFAKMQLELDRLVFISFVAELIAFLIAMWVLYMVIKAAVRDGLRESGLVEALRRRSVTPKPEGAAALPEWAKGN